MAQVIIYKNPDGPNVCVCAPTPDYLIANTIEDVMAKDCPPDAIIVDDSILPQGADIEFFDAWVLNGSTVSVDFSKAQSDYLVRFNNHAIKAVNTRNLNTLAGISNTINDETWMSNLNASREAIENASTTAELLAIQYPTP
jgi:hypothetical protein